MLLLQIVLIAAVATLLAVWCGWGVSRLALPPTLRPYLALCTPLVGYALLLVLAYHGVRDLAGLALVMPVVLLLTGAANLLAWRLGGPPRFSRAALFDNLPIFGLLLVTFVSGVLPLFSYGYAGIMGTNWDTETYLPLAHWLERAPYSAITTAPPNPMWSVIDNRYVTGLTLGFSIWQGSADLITRLEPLTTFAPLLAWLRALGVLGVYLLFVSVLGLHRYFALLGTALLSASGLLLWVTYFNFGMQLSSWPLVPLGLFLGIACVRDAAERGLRAWPPVVLCALVFAAMPVAYYPVLTVFLPLAAGLGLALFLERGARRARLLAASISVGALTIAFSVLPIVDFTQGYDFAYSIITVTLGLFRYVPLTDLAGLTPFNLTNAEPVPVWAWAALGVMSALCAAGLALGKFRLRWAGLVLGAVAYMAWLRWGQQYPYAWMKGGSFIAFPFLGLAASGAQALWDRRPRAALLRVGAVAAALALLALMLVAEGRVVAQFWSGPGLYGDLLPGLSALRQKVAPPCSVTLTSDQRFKGVTSGLVAYLLDSCSVLGVVQTGYKPFWSHGLPDQVGDYAVLMADEDPAAWGFSHENLIWSSAKLALYKRGRDVLAHLGLERALAPGDSLPLQIGPDQLTGPARAETGGSEGRKVEIALASFSPIEVTVGDANYNLPPGAHSVTTPQLATPKKLDIRNKGGAPFTLRWATLRPPSGDPTQPVTQTQTAAVLAQARAVASGSTVTATVDSLLSDAGPLVLALDMWDRKRGKHYGWYGIERSRLEPRSTMTLTLDIPSGVMYRVDDKGAKSPVSAAPATLAKGDYTAELQVLAGNRLLAEPKEVFTFSLDAGKRVTQAGGITTPLIVASADRPAVYTDVDAGGDTRLLGYALGGGPIRPGEEVSLTLWWRAVKGGLDERSVLLHLLNAKGERIVGADAAPAGGGRPTSSWQAGETIIDSHTVKLPPTTPPGAYHFAVGMYRYPSLEPIHLTRNGEGLPGDVLTIPLTVER